MNGDRVSIPTFQQRRRRLAGDPGAKDGGVEDHGDLEHAIRQLRHQPLRPRFVGGRQAVPQREIEPLYKTDDEDRQQTGADPSYPVLVREGVHAGRGDGGYCDYAGLDQHEAPVIALIVIVARDPFIDVPDQGADPGRAVVLVEVESQHIFPLVEKLDAHPPRSRYCCGGILLMPSSRSLAMRSFSSIHAFFSARYLSLICSSLNPLCLSTVCATKFQATSRAPMAAERVSRRIA